MSSPTPPFPPTPRAIADRPLLLSRYHTWKPVIQHGRGLDIFRPGDVTSSSDNKMFDGTGYRTRESRFSAHSPTQVASIGLPMALYYSEGGYDVWQSVEDSSGNAAVVVETVGLPDHARVRDGDLVRDELWGGFLNVKTITVEAAFQLGGLDESITFSLPVVPLDNAGDETQRQCPRSMTWDWFFAVPEGGDGPPVTWTRKNTSPLDGNPETDNLAGYELPDGVAANAHDYWVVAYEEDVDETWSETALWDGGAETQGGSLMLYQMQLEASMSWGEDVKVITYHDGDRWHSGTIPSLYLTASVESDYSGDPHSDWAGFAASDTGYWALDPRYRWAGVDGFGGIVEPDGNVILSGTEEYNDIIDGPTFPLLPLRYPKKRAAIRSGRLYRVRGDNPNGIERNSSLTWLGLPLYEHVTASEFPGIPDDPVIFYGIDASTSSQPYPKDALDLIPMDGIAAEDMDAFFTRTVRVKTESLYGPNAW